MNELNFFYTLASESELNEILVGRGDPIAFHWPSYSIPTLTPGSTGVLWKHTPTRSIKPLALIAHDADLRRLCVRFARLRSDLSPLTAWCHLLTPNQFEQLKSPTREAFLSNLEAAWTGLVIAEVVLATGKPLKDITVAQCLATKSFAIGRTAALWADKTDQQIIELADSITHTLQTNGLPAQSHRTLSNLERIWETLLALNRGDSFSPNHDLRPLVASLQELYGAREVRFTNEAERFARPLMNAVPESEAFYGLPQMVPEQRLKLFDMLVDNLEKEENNKLSLRRNALALLAGYLATVAAGGSPTLSLAENKALRFPDITAWAYVTGGIGERVIWTSSFDGLGRMVAKELIRSFHIGDSPSCDFALNEASVLVDRKLPDPFVHLYIKGRVATVAVLPGVNVVVEMDGARAKMTENRFQSQRNQQPDEPLPAGRNIFAALADALWPHLRSRFEQLARAELQNDYAPQNYNRSKSKKKQTSQPSLTGPKR